MADNFIVVAITEVHFLVSFGRLIDLLAMRYGVFRGLLAIPQNNVKDLKTVVSILLTFAFFISEFYVAAKGDVEEDLVGVSLSNIARQ